MAVCLALVSSFYLSFSFVTKYHSNKAVEYAQGDAAKEYQYLDSVAGEKVWFEILNLAPLPEPYGNQIPARGEYYDITNPPDDKQSDNDGGDPDASED